MSEISSDPVYERFGSQARTLRQLLILNQVSMAMQSSLELERLLHIILSGVTAGEALGLGSTATVVRPWPAKRASISSHPT